ncbi:MAG: hypothetical protein ACRDT2_11370 [Natronosporangium sp.]
MDPEPDRSALGPPPPNPYGAFAAVDGLGGTAAPLLAGFSITLMVLVIELAATLRWPDLALVLLGAAVVMFLQVVQLNARARGYAVTPAQVREWYPDFDHPDRQAIVVRELRHHRACWVYLVRRTRLRYNLGILALLCAIAAVLVPRGDVGGWRLAAIAMVLVGVGLELLEIVDGQLRRGRGRQAGGWPRRSLRWLAPADPPIPASFMDERPDQPPQ